MGLEAKDLTPHLPNPCVSPSSGHPGWCRPIFAALALAVPCLGGEQDVYEEHLLVVPCS